jgi:hypothetical protein
MQLLLLLMITLFAGQSTMTGLPRFSVHHKKLEGFMHCDCGCDCSDHPDTADSCLNPLNIHQAPDCGCEKEHELVILPPLPELSSFVSPKISPELLAPSISGQLFLLEDHFPLEPMLACLQPPH